MLEQLALAGLVDVEHAHARQAHAAEGLEHRVQLVDIARLEVEGPRVVATPQLGGARAHADHWQAQARGHGQGRLRMGGGPEAADRDDLLAGQRLHVGGGLLGLVGVVELDHFDGLPAPLGCDRLLEAGEEVEAHVGRAAPLDGVAHHGRAAQRQREADLERGLRAQPGRCGKCGAGGQGGADEAASTDGGHGGCLLAGKPVVPAS